MTPTSTRHLRRILVAASAFLGLLAGAAAAGADRREQLLDAWSALPQTFVENRGQTDPRVLFHARGPHQAVFVTRDGIVLSLAAAAAPDGARRIPTAAPAAPRQAALALRFVGANPDVEVAGAERVAGTTNDLIGSDPSRWQTGLAGWAQVVYRDLWPGVDMAVRAQGGGLKYEFRVRPGGRPDSIRLAYAGADGIALDAAGALLVRSPIGVLRDAAPVSYQTVDGARLAVASRYRLDDGGVHGFEVDPGYRRDRELVIDPALEYSTLIGGNGGEIPSGIAVDAAGNAYIVGTTQSLNFPATVGAFDRTPGDQVNGPDAFVAKINPGGTALVYATYLGGSGADFGRAIAIDAAGNAYVTGRTQSPNFPTTGGAFDRTPNVPQTPRPQTIEDGFVAKLNASGSALLYSTYLGGTDNDELRAIAVDAAGNAYVTGETVSLDFPTTAGAFRRTLGGEYDVFVTKLNPTGSALVYSTFLGGTVSDIANAIKLDGANQAVVVGSTRSADFPTTPGAFDTTHNGGFDAFVTKLNAAGSALVWSTFLGSSGWDDGSALALDAAGNVYVAGGAGAPEFPTTPGAFDRTYSAEAGDGFVAKLDPTGSTLVWSTFLRGAGPAAIARDAAGTIWMTGTTAAETFPVTADAFDLSLGGTVDAFVAALNPSGTALVYATLLGGANNDHGNAIALDAAGNVYVAGDTLSSDFPTTPGALDRGFAGDLLVFWGDGFVAKFNAAAVAPSFPGPTLAALALNPVTVAAGAASTGTVTLSAPALVGGAVVALADDSTVTAVPASVTVPAGATSATFAVATNTSAPDGAGARVSGTLGTTRSASLTILPVPPLLAGVAVQPASVVGGNPTTATVTLSAPQATPTVVSIDPAPPTTPATLPASVTVAAGATTASFAIPTTPVTMQFNLTIGVRLQGAPSPGPTTLLLITPGAAPAPTLASLSLSATSVVGGGFLTGTVTLTGPAPAGGAVVTLSDDSAAASTPSSVTVGAGANANTFILTSTPVAADTPVLLTATYAGVSRTAALTVTAAAAQRTLTVSATGRSGERVTSSPAGISVAVGSSGAAAFANRTAITLSATNGRDAIWSGACSSGGAKRRTCTFTIDADAAVTANVK